MRLKLYTIKLCRKDEYGKLVSFLHDHWNEKHVFVRNKEIFEFQHNTLGEEYNFVVAVHNQTGEIHAVLGFILPETFNHEYDEVPEAVYGALWKVRDDIENNEIGKLGLGVLSYLLKRYHDSDYITLGLSKDSQAIYEALHFNFGKMNHYYIASKYVNEFVIAQDPVINHDSTINYRFEVMFIDDIPDDFDPYYHPTKNKTYIENRYLNHPFYKYKLLGIYENNELKAVLVTRKCDALNSSCLRIIDIVGNLGTIDNIEGNIEELLKENGAEYIDCYNCGINKEVFLKIGFKEVTGNTVIPNYFEPFEKRNVDIHYATYAHRPVVVFKGDGDQDRPNLLEVKMEKSVETRVKEIIAEILKVDVEQINEDTAIGDIPEWDSLSQIQIISSIEKEFGFNFTPDVMMDLEDVSDIVAAVEERI